jgi:hypothetical protein
MSIFKKASVMPIVRSVISQGLDDYNNPDPGMEDAALRGDINRSWETNVDKRGRESFKPITQKQKFIEALNEYSNSVELSDSDSDDYRSGMLAAFAKAAALADKIL